MSTAKSRAPRRKKAKTKTKKKRTSRAKKASVVEDGGDDNANVEVKGGKLVVRISREVNPEIYDIDRLGKHLRKMIESYGRKKRARDLVHFLAETEKSVQIILRNHLEAAMREYLK